MHFLDMKAHRNEHVYIIVIVYYRLLLSFIVCCYTDYNYYDSL